jgi:hypothetical protein
MASQLPSHTNTRNCCNHRLRSGSWKTPCDRAIAGSGLPVQRQLLPSANSCHWMIIQTPWFPGHGRHRECDHTSAIARQIHQAARTCNCGNGSTLCEHNRNELRRSFTFILESWPTRHYEPASKPDSHSASLSNLQSDSHWQCSAKLSVEKGRDCNSWCHIIDLHNTGD